MHDAAARLSTLKIDRQNLPSSIAMTRSPRPQRNDFHFDEPAESGINTTDIDAKCVDHAKATDERRTSTVGCQPEAAEARRWHLFKPSEPDREAGKLRANRMARAACG